MRDPEQAAHALGKLLLYVGASNILWGTDSIWYGSPQDQIQAFRTFQNRPRPAREARLRRITPEVRAKIFGRNAAKVYGLSAAEIKKYTTGIQSPGSGRPTSGIRSRISRLMAEDSARVSAVPQG